MNIRLEPSLFKFKKQVEPILLKKEACNNLMLGIMNRLEHEELKDESNCHLGVVEVNEKAIYAFMQTPTNNWILADVDTVYSNVIRQIANFLYDNKMEVPGVLGKTQYAEIFKEEWEQLTRIKAVVHMKQLIYRLDHINQFSHPAGQLIEASAQDRPLVKTWLQQFGIEANESFSDEKADKIAETFIENRSLHLWVVDGEPVSMANQTRSTRNGATINAVFTPDAYKRNGYATAAVTLLSEKLLNAGFKFYSLYTDLENPTSNNIYKKIGYYEAGSSIVYVFNN